MKYIQFPDALGRLMGCRDSIRRHAMEFAYSDKVTALQDKLKDFMDLHIYPNEAQHAREVETGDRWQPTALMEALKKKAKLEGLWNLFLPHSPRGAGLSNLEYAPLCEIRGRVPMASEVFNCSAPDTGNMETLELYGSDDQKTQWLDPLLAGEIRSCFAMTEPAVASSDATNIESTILRDGDHYVINGRKWWTTGAPDPRCQIAIFMGKTDPSNPDRHRQQSMVLVPMDSPGVNVLRPLSVFGYDDAPHGAAERALEDMCKRVKSRVAFGKPLAEQTVTLERIAEARIMIEQARLLVLKAAYMMDTVGNKVARAEIAMIKVAVPKMLSIVVDMAIQAHGAAGLSGDFGLAKAYATARALRLVDGPDEVHRNQIGQLELRKYN